MVGKNDENMIYRLRHFPFSPFPHFPISSLLLFCLLSSVFFFLPDVSFANFDFNPRCLQAMQAALDLRLIDAQKLIDEEKASDPGNGYAIYLEHYTESIGLIISENEELYTKLIDSYEERMEKMDELDDGSPDNRWLQAEMLFQVGLAQIKFGNRFNGATKILASYRKTRSLRQEFPGFWQIEKLTGIYNIILDFIPPYMRWASDMFGVSGNSELGLYQLQHYYEKARDIPGLAEESVIVANLAYKLTWQEEKGLVFLAWQNAEILDNTLVRYLYANTANFANHSGMALEILSGIQREEIQAEFYNLDYLTGRCKLNHLEPGANIYLQYYLDHYPGPDYKKDACNRLSFYYLIFGDLQKYQEYRAMIGQVGQELRDPDQDAVLESRADHIQHTGLLKARLLCDGGYFEEAMECMNAIDPGQLGELAYKLEYHYRLGRIYQLGGRPEMAITELTRAFDDGKSAPYTFATRAALNLGKIYEEKKEYATASRWYKSCIEVFSSVHTTEGVKDMAEKGGKRVKW